MPTFTHKNKPYWFAVGAICCIIMILFAETDGVKSLGTWLLVIMTVAFVYQYFIKPERAEE